MFVIFSWLSVALFVGKFLRVLALEKSYEKSFSACSFQDIHLGKEDMVMVASLRMLFPTQVEVEKLQIGRVGLEERS